METKKSTSKKAYKRKNAEIELPAKPKVEVYKANYAPPKQYKPEILTVHGFKTSVASFKIDNESSDKEPLEGEILTGMNGRFVEIYCSKGSVFIDIGDMISEAANYLYETDELPDPTFEEAEDK